MKKYITYPLFFGYIFQIFLISHVFGSDNQKLVISPFAGGYLFEGQQVFGGNTIYGLNLGYQFSKNWAVRLGGATGEFQHAYLDDQSFVENIDDFDVKLGYLDLMFHIPIFNRFTPYLFLGGGDLFLDLENKDQNHFPFLKYGAGTKIQLTNTISLWGECAHKIVQEDQEIVDRSGTEYRNNLMYVGGLSFSFGNRPRRVRQPAEQQKSYQKSIAKIPRKDILYDINGNPWDSDGDGVNEQKDLCAATPKGVPVGPNGCPFDEDNDGVFDYEDQCKNTDRYVTVDKYGCPKDSDGDGVYDMEDQCQDTPKTAVVDLKGCPVDNDKDGVYDGMDQCPETEPGMQVDEKGCPQLTESVTFSLNITFKSNSAEVDPQYFEELKKLADTMNKYPKSRVVIEAHTDNTGSNMANLKLSQKRANSVRSFVINYFDIEPYRIEAVGFGEEKPIADNRTPSGRRQNRRAIAILSNHQ